MSYRGSVALATNEAYERPAEAPERPEFEVVVGGGLDAAARQGVSPEFLRAVRVAVIAVALFLLVGVARVAITASTVTLMRDNSTIRTQISQVESANDSLRIERSSLSSSSRISDIATGAYGMVSAEDTEQLQLDATDATNAVD